MLVWHGAFAYCPQRLTHRDVVTDEPPIEHAMTRSASRQAVNVVAHDTGPSIETSAIRTSDGLCCVAVPRLNWHAAITAAPTIIPRTSRLRLTLLRYQVPATGGGGTM